MDKNLKKLSRVQLLQLMVQLSEDRDALVAENAELRKRVEERPPVATSMKVGSIAEAALQANGYFESAQNAADEYLREIKRMRDQVASRVGAMNAGQAQQAQQAKQAQAQAAQQPVRQAQPLEKVVPEVKPVVSQPLSANQQQQVDQIKATAVQEARAMSDRVLARANAQAKAVIDDAQTRADAIIAEANRRSHTIVTRANRQAEAMLGEAKQKIAGQQAARQEADVQQNAQQESIAQQNTVQDQPAKAEAASSSAKTSGPSAQQQVSARQLGETLKSPSTTAEIAMRARHVRNA